MIVLLYSNQDTEFVQTFQVVSKNPDLRKLINMVNVNNEVVYNTITTSTNIQIYEVPCILVVKGENISKYEGYEKVNAYINEMIQYIENAKQPKFTDINSLGLVEEETNDYVETQPTKQPLRTRVSQQASDIKQSRIPADGSSVANGDNSSPGSIRITSPSQKR